MKLLKQDGNSFTFLIGKRERDLFLAVLLRYPALSASHFDKRSSAPEDADRELLRDALAEQQKETRKALDEWLNADGRFKENDLGFTFTLAAAEMDWMLQLLNNVRVGTWVELGEPDGKTPPPAEITEQTMQLVWILEMAGLFQNELLEALQTAP